MVYSLFMLVYKHSCKDTTKISHDSFKGSQGAPTRQQEPRLSSGRETGRAPKGNFLDGYLAHKVGLCIYRSPNPRNTPPLHVESTAVLGTHMEILNCSSLRSVVRIDSERVPT